MEFYLASFDVLKKYLVKLMEESKKIVNVLGALNSTFITLIPIRYDDGSMQD